MERLILSEGGLFPPVGGCEYSSGYSARVGDE